MGEAEIEAILASINKKLEIVLSRLSPGKQEREILLIEAMNRRKYLCWSIIEAEEPDLGKILYPEIFRSTMGRVAGREGWKCIKPNQRQKIWYLPSFDPSTIPQIIRKPASRNNGDRPGPDDSKLIDWVIKSVLSAAKEINLLDFLREQFPAKSPSWYDEIISTTKGRIRRDKLLITFEGDRFWNEGKR